MDAHTSKNRGISRYFVGMRPNIFFQEVFASVRSINNRCKYLFPSFSRQSHFRYKSQRRHYNDINDGIKTHFLAYRDLNPAIPLLMRQVLPIELMQKYFIAVSVFIYNTYPPEGSNCPIEAMCYFTTRCHIQLISV